MVGPTKVVPFTVSQSLLVCFTLLAWCLCCSSGTAQTNLALDRPAGASSFYSGAGGSFPPTNAVDGKLSTRWEASGGSFPQWLVVDLGRIYSLTSVRQTFYDSDTWYYKLEASNDNGVQIDATWTVLADHTAGITGRSFTDSVSGNFRYVRLYVTNANADWATSEELAAYGSTYTQIDNVVPPPVPIKTGNYIVGAQMCNLWADSVFWDTIVPYPHTYPLMGYYDEAKDISTDWQIKMAVDHGIAFFQSCWYRMADNAGQSPVLASYDQFINSIANTAKYRSDIKWTIDWDDNTINGSYVTSVADFEDNLVPYWINNYFVKPNYYKIGNKPVMTIFDYEEFKNEVGGLSNAAAAISYFRQAAVNAGFAGLILITMNNVTTTQNNSDAKAEGFDYISSYNIPTFTELIASSCPTDTQILSEQETAWNNWKANSEVPSIVSASMGWNSAPWAEGSTFWRLTPSDYTSLLEEAQTAMAARKGLPSQMILLDNWNEFGEGHYIAPTAQYGYGYLDAIASIFSPGSDPVDLTPNISLIPQIAVSNTNPPTQLCGQIP